MSCCPCFGFLGAKGPSQSNLALRRLTIAHTDDPDIVDEGNTANNLKDFEVEKGLVELFKKTDVMALIDKHTDPTANGRLAPWQLAQGKAKKASIASTVDHAQKAFANKQVAKQGDAWDSAAACMGFTCRRGLKAGAPNQDSWSAIQLDNKSVYCVYDGHGQNGHDVGEFVKDNMPKLIVTDERFSNGKGMPEMMMEAFVTMQGMVGYGHSQNQFGALVSGTTASVVIHSHAEKKLTITHVGDSSAVLGSFDVSRKTLKASMLTRDHHPGLPEERARITEAGGIVEIDAYGKHRIYTKGSMFPSLNLSRCLGDLMAHQRCGCSAEPEVSEVLLKPEDHVLLLCSDGVWEFISPERAVEIVSEFGPESAQQAADKLAQEAWKRWIDEEKGEVVDDITALVIFLAS